MLLENQIPKGKILEQNEVLLRIMNDTKESFKEMIANDISFDTKKMGSYLHSYDTREQFLPGRGVQDLGNNRDQ